MATLDSLVSLQSCSRSSLIEIATKPIESVDYIFSLAAEDSRECIPILCLLSKRYRSIATPLLWQRVSVELDVTVAQPWGKYGEMRRKSTYTKGRKTMTTFHKVGPGVLTLQRLSAALDNDPTLIMRMKQFDFTVTNEYYDPRKMNIAKVIRIFHQLEHLQRLTVTHRKPPRSSRAS
jgi:hypothetical protein